VSNLDLSKGKLLGGQPETRMPPEPQCKYTIKIMPNINEAAMGQLPGLGIVGAPCLRDACAHWDADEKMCSDLVMVKLLKQLVNKEKTNV